MEMEERIPRYRYAKVGEIQGNVLSPINPKFEVVKDGKFVDIHKCTDNLMNVISERLPKPVKSSADVNKVSEMIAEEAK